MKQLLATSMAGVAILAGAGAEDADAKRRAAIVSPSAASAVVTGRPVPVVVALPRGSRGHAIELDNRSITRRFRRAGAGRIRARLPRSIAKPGFHHLTATVRTRSGRRIELRRTFVVGERRAQLLRLRTPRHAVRGVARVGLRPAGRLHRGFHRFEVRLNGRDVTHRFRATTGLPEHGHLSAAVGLREGWNGLVVRAARRDGTYDVKRALIRVRGDSPRPSAGRSHLVRKAGRVVRLDGTASRASRPGMRLSYRWRIVQRPAGSKAKLRGARSARPRLRLDRRGTYRVALQVTERRRGRRARATASAAGGVRAVADQVKLVATPAYVPPIGVPVRIQTHSNEQTDSTPVHIGNTVYPRTDNFQVLTLDPVTLEPTPNATEGNESFADPDDAIADIKSAAKGTIVVVSGDSYNDWLDNSSDGQHLNSIGLDNTLMTDDWVWEDTRFALLGVRGIAQGNGYASVPDTNTWDERVGTLTGYLTQNQAGTGFTFTPGQYDDFDTNLQQAGEGATSVTVRVGSTEVTSDTLPSGQSGFFVGVFNSMTLEQLDAATFAVNTGDGGTDAANTQAMADYLANYSDDPLALVVVQSIGAVKPTAQAQWSAVADQIEYFGGESQTFNSVGNTGKAGGYSLVGQLDVYRLWMEPPPAETASNLYTFGDQGVATRLSGLLEVTHTGRFVPSGAGAVTDSIETPDTRLPLLAYQESSDWPVPKTAAQEAAYHWISSEAGVADNGYDLRARYAESNYDFHTFVGADFECAAGSWQGTRFSAADCEAVVEQLETEWTDYLQPVQGWFDDLHGVLSDVQQDKDENLSAIATKIENAIKPPPTNIDPEVDFTSLADALLDLLWASEPVPELEGIAKMAGVLQGVFEIAESFNYGSHGEDLSQIVAQDATDLGVQSGANYLAMIGGIYNLEAIISTDYEKLVTMASLAGGRDPSWDLDDHEEALAATMVFGARQMFYESLLWPLYVDMEIPDLYWHWDAPGPTWKCHATPTQPCGSNESHTTDNPWDYNCPNWDANTIGFVYNFQPFADLANGKDDLPASYYNRIDVLGASQTWHVMAYYANKYKDKVVWAPQELMAQLVGPPATGNTNAGYPIHYAFDVLEPHEFQCGLAGAEGGGAPDPPYPQR